MDDWDESVFRPEYTGQRDVRTFTHIFTQTFTQAVTHIFTHMFTHAHWRG
eukprot:COSAG06_NODE_15275_length_1084_cov_1.158376_1_plen_50_part_00